MLIYPILVFYIGYLIYINGDKVKDYNTILINNFSRGYPHFDILNSEVLKKN